MSGTTGSAFARLAEERKAWRKGHPFGFVAKPTKKDDGTVDWLEWECAIPGMKGTPWEGGMYKLRIFFDEGYPNTLPTCKFEHPFGQIHSTGMVYLHFFNCWESTVSIKKILMKLQCHFMYPSEDGEADLEAYASKIWTCGVIESKDQHKVIAIDPSSNDIFKNGK